MAPHSSILPGKPHGQRSLAGYSPWGRQESDTTERLSLPFPRCLLPVSVGHRHPVSEVHANATSTAHRLDGCGLLLL